MEYKILIKLQMSEGTIEGTVKMLTEEVNNYIKQGWKPLGGVTYAQESHLRWVMQAMIKDEPVRNNSTSVTAPHVTSPNDPTPKKRSRR